MSPLNLTAKHGRLEATRWLVENQGANLDINCSGEKFSPLWLAVRYDHLDVAQYLLENGATHRVSQDKERNTPLGVAACLGNLPAAKMLLEHDADLVNKPASATGASPLWFAAYNGCVELCQWLILSAGAAVSATPTGSDMDVLAIAAHAGHADLVRWLLERSDVRCDLGKMSKKAAALVIRLQRENLAKALENVEWRKGIPDDVNKFISDVALSD